MTKDALDLWVVEYSPIQRQFHKHQLRDMISKNSQMFFDGHTKMNGYMPIAICDTPEDADRVYSMLADYRDKKEGIVYQEEP